MIGFRILQLPLDSWQEYKAIRLKALKTDPQAFLSPYSKESAYPDEKWQQRLEEANAGISSWVYFAQNEGKLVGMIGGYRDENDLRSHAAEIWGLFVTPDQRRRGIAKALMSTIIEKLKEDKDITTLRLEVNTDQDSAKRLYEHFDFKSLETIPLTLGDGVEHQVTKMEKHLSPNPSGVTKT